MDHGDTLSLTGRIGVIDLVCSIPPTLVRLRANGENVGPAYQAACAASWLRNGFRSRSLNPAREIPALPAIAGVGFEPFVARDDIVDVGHPGPSLGTIFDVVAAEGPCVVVNGDVYLLSIPDLPTRLNALCRDSLVVARRTDVTDLLGPAHGVFATGIDFVAFRPDLMMPILRDPGIRQFQLGVPWWDYVLPIAASFLHPVRRIREPFLVHHAHPAQWDNEQYGRVRIRARAVLADFARRQPESERAREFLRRLSIADAAGSAYDADREFSILCMEWLFGPSGPVEEVELPLASDDAVLRSLVRSGLTGAGDQPVAAVRSPGPPPTVPSAPDPASDEKTLSAPSGLVDEIETRPASDDAVVPMLARCGPASAGGEQAADAGRQSTAPLSAAPRHPESDQNMSRFLALLPRIRSMPAPVGRAMTRLELLARAERPPRLREILASASHDLGGLAYLDGKALERHFRPGLRRLAGLGIAVRRKSTGNRRNRFLVGGSEVRYPIALFQLGRVPVLAEIVGAVARDLCTVGVLLYRLSRARPVAPPDLALGDEPETW